MEENAPGTYVDDTTSTQSSTSETYNKVASTNDVMTKGRTFSEIAETHRGTGRAHPPWRNMGVVYSITWRHLWTSPKENSPYEEATTEYQKPEPYSTQNRKENTWKQFMISYIYNNL